ncbi:ankyrin repeat-containing domain protein [Chaetomium tenue]|uniref:Ankyrin repeat-containing domain protein n=1 Tax=Chaetomium tenue TaxID=1854479 RepID=A0ACB7PLW0_9PEZI|nr:ankyrin repeat-containing domain protein [Chaetomium globosum]
MADNPDSSDGLPTADLTPAAAVDALEPKSEPGVEFEPGPAKPKQTQTLGLKIHVDNDSADYDVIAVHGIHGDATAWGIDKSSLETTDDWVEKEATSLLMALQQHRQGIKNRPIVFVTHDIGGLIVKAVRRRPTTVSGQVITFGYPHVSARSATCDLTEEFVLLVNLRSESSPSSRVRRIAASLAETCVEVNSDFIHAGVVVRTRIVSIASQHKDKIKRVFGASTVCFGKSLEHDITSNEPHLDLIKIGTTGPGALKEVINADWKATYIFILANFDECDDSSLAFLDQLRLTFSKTERQFRFVVTTSTGADERLLEALPNAAPDCYERVQLDGTSARNNSSSGQSGSENTTDIEFQLSMFFQRHPQYTTDNIENQIKDAITVRYKDRPDLRTHITGWLKFLFLSDDLATTMAHAKDGQGEPPNLGSSSGGKYGLNDLQQLRFFGGLIEERNGEVRLVNRSIRRWLLSKLDQDTTPGDEKEAEAVAEAEAEGRQWYACLGTEVQRHLSIVKFCLDFLTTFKSDAPLKALGYASQHWATHYKLARSLNKEAIESIHAEISIFFEDATAWGAWWQTYSELANRLHTLDQVETRLQIAAHLGLDDFVESFKDGVDPHSTSYRQALAQAAEMGHLESLRLLLPPNGAQFDVGLHDVNIQKYAEAAARGGGECLREVIGRIPKEDLSDMEERPFLCNILGRAAWDGLDGVIRLIRGPGPYTDPSSDCTFLPMHSPLSLAVRRYHLAAVQAFLDLGVKADVSCCDSESGRGVPAVNIAADYGSDEALALLLENGAAVVTTVSDRTTIQGAVDWGQHAVVKRLVAHSPYRDYITSGYSNDPVIRSADLGYLKTFEAAFVSGVDVNFTSAVGTLIYHATYGENIELCRLLLSKGADANMSTALGRTPLGRAAFDNSLEIAELLLNHGAEIDRPCTLPEIADTVPPLYIAIAKQRKEMVALLLAHKADPNAQDPDGLSVLCVASFLGGVEIINQLVTAGAEVNMACAQKRTALQMAVKHPEAVRALMKHGADLRRTTYGFTPLDLAVEQNTESTVVQIMLEESPEKPDFSSANFRSIFARAMRAGKHEIARLLFEAGVDVNQDCYHPTGLSLLSLAVLSNHVDTVRMVLEFRPDLQNGNVDGDTPLQYITESTSVEIARLLVNADCALDAINKKGNSPLSNAVKHRNLAVVKYMLTKPSALRTLNLVGGDNTIPLHLACQYADVEMVALLLAHGADLTGTDPLGRRPIHMACYNSLDALRALDVPTEHFAIRDKLGRLPLHYAVLSGRADLLEEVLARSAEAGVAVDEADGDGWTPLLWAARAVGLWGRRDGGAPAAAAAALGMGNAGGGEGEREREREVGVVGEVDRDGEPETYECYRSKDVVHPNHDFTDNGYDHDSDVEESDSETKPAINGSPTSGKLANDLGGGDDHEEAFDDEVVSDDDGDLWGVAKEM